MFWGTYNTPGKKSSKQSFSFLSIKLVSILLYPKTSEENNINSGSWSLLKGIASLVFMGRELGKEDNKCNDTRLISSI